MKRKDNVEFVSELMQFASSGPLMQVFIIEAISHYADKVSAIPVDKLDAGAFVHPVAWHNTAVEAQGAIRKRYLNRDA